MDVRSNPCRPGDFCYFFAALRSLTQRLALSCALWPSLALVAHALIAVFCFAVRCAVAVSCVAMLFLMHPGMTLIL